MKFKQLWQPLFFLYFFMLALIDSSPAKENISRLKTELSNAHSSKEIIKACSLSHQLSVQLWIDGKVDSSLIYALETNRLAIEIGDTAFQIKGLSNCAYNHQQKGDFQSAAHCFERAIELAEKTHDTLQWANSIENLSVVYGATGITDYPKALGLLLKAAKLKEDSKAFSYLPGTYKNISAIFKAVNDTLNREIYLLKAVDLVDQGKAVNPTFQAAVYNEAGRFYTDERRDLNKAESYFTKVLEVSKKINWKKGISASLSNLANVKELQGDYPAALSMLEETLKIKTEINDFYGIVNVQYSIGDIYYQLKMYPLARQHYQKARDLAMEKNLSNEIAKSYKGLYKTFREMGNFQAALANLEEHLVLADSLTGAEHKKILAELETKYQTEKKEQQIVQLTNEKEIEALKARQRMLVALVLGSLLVLLVAIGILVIRQKNLRNQHRLSELNQKLLRSQMNPHFIFNALGTIQSYIYDNKASDAALYLSKFAKLMRNILESSINEKIPFEEEIETVTNYLILQQLRSKNHFSFEIKADEGLYEESIPPMLAQPFIENAVKHAFTPDVLDGTIVVSYSLNNNFISIVVRDNGLGINATRQVQKDHKSHAIRLTCERLALYNKENRKSGSIQLTDLSETGGKGTRVEIQFKAR